MFSNALVSAQVEQPIVDETPTEQSIEATFKGGMSAMYKFIDGNIEVPHNTTNRKIYGTVKVQFVIGKDGCIEQVEASHSGGLSEEYVSSAIDVIEKMKCKWNPATQRGKPVRMRYIIPITFNVDVPKYKKNKSANN